MPTVNARFALNAANARWGSLYDALYGTDVISDEGGAEQGRSHNPVRANEVIAYARDLLNSHFPLHTGSHSEACCYRINNQQWVVELNAGNITH